tara:strand:+ start:750 stop:923 length:174 start_codon:yes stop_codon:yes gene_type:complete
MVQEFELIEVNITLDYLDVLNHYLLARYSLGFEPVLETISNSSLVNLPIAVTFWLQP